MLVCSFAMNSRKGLARGAVGARHSCWLLHTVKNAVGHNGSQRLGLCLLRCQVMKCNKLSHESVKNCAKCKKPTNPKQTNKTENPATAGHLLSFCAVAELTTSNINSAVVTRILRVND